MAIFSSALLVVLFSLSSLFVPATASDSDSCCASSAEVETPEHRALIISNYLSIWNGDVSFANTTFSPTPLIKWDRLPSSTGVGSDVVTLLTPDAFGAFAASLRVGWQNYTIIEDKSVGDENLIGLKWRLEGIMGEGFALPTTVKVGDPVTHHGMDFFVLNKCTGLVDELYTTQNSIEYFHDLGLTGVSV